MLVAIHMADNVQRIAGGKANGQCIIFFISYMSDSTIVGDLKVIHGYVALSIVNL